MIPRRRFLTTTAAVMLVVAGPRTVSGRSALGSGLYDSLLAIEGEFHWDAGRQDYVFSDRPGLAALLSPSAEANLPALVACIDDVRPARATLDGRPVSLGVVCYQALRLVAYVEAPAEGGKVWLGHIGPLATPDARRAARQAWESALVEGSYVLH